MKSVKTHLSDAWNLLYAFFTLSGFKLFSLANSSKAAFFAFLAWTTFWPDGGAGTVDLPPAAPPLASAPILAGAFLPPVTME